MKATIWEMQPWGKTDLQHVEKMMILIHEKRERRSHAAGKKIGLKKNGLISMTEGFDIDCVRCFVNTNR